MLFILDTLQAGILLVDPTTRNGYAADWMIKHTTTYKELKPLYSEYKKSRDKEKYLRWREREIILFEASGVGDKLPDLAKLREEDSRLSEEKD